MLVFRFFLLLLSLHSALLSHQTGLSYVVIDEKSKDNISILYKKPLSDTRGADIVIRYPKRCLSPLQISNTIENGFILRRYRLHCKEGGLLGSRIWVEGLVLQDRGVLISYKKDDFKATALLRSVTPFMEISKESSQFELFWEYLVLGVSHIWSGFDHLLFVLSLILLSLSLRSLLWSITGFTLAHSITLAAGILGIVNIGVAYIEAMIALSILFLARELLLDGESFTKRHLGIVAFIFGLLHGFGFSNVLRTIGLPQDEIPLSLFSFNLGIEIGQLLFIGVVIIFLTLLKHFSSFPYEKTKRFLAYGVGIVSSYWLIERVLAF